MREPIERKEVYEKVLDAIHIMADSHNKNIVFKNDFDRGFLVALSMIRDEVFEMMKIEGWLDEELKK